MLSFNTIKVSTSLEINAKLTGFKEEGRTRIWNQHQRSETLLVELGAKPKSQYPFFFGLT